MPEGPYGLVSRYFWIVFIAVTLINGVIWWFAAQQHIRKDPSLEPGYRRLIRGWMIFANIPWIVMGIGILFGGVPGVFHYFNAKNGPYVIAWYVSIVVLWIVTAYWLFLRNGAEDLVRYKGMLRYESASPWMIKLFFLAGVAGGIVALCVFFFSDLQVS